MRLGEEAVVIEPKAKSTTADEVKTSALVFTSPTNATQTSLLAFVSSPDCNQERGIEERKVKKLKQSALAWGRGRINKVNN